MKYCSHCGKQLGIFSRKHNHKIDEIKIEIWCHNCHVRQQEKIVEENNRKMNELRKIETQLKIEKKFIEKIINAINNCDFSSVNFKRRLEVRDYTCKDGIFTINVLGNYSCSRYDHRYTVENMRKHKRWGFERCLGNTIVKLSEEKQTYEYKEIIVIFWGEKYDKYGHGTWVRYASFTLVPNTLKKMILENLSKYEVLQVFDHEIGDFPNDLG